MGEQSVEVVKSVYEAFGARTAQGRLHSPPMT
jgi:hypothetical protein